MFVFIVSVLLYLYLSVSLFACLYITILSVLPEWRINFINCRTFVQVSIMRRLSCDSYASYSFI